MDTIPNCLGEFREIRESKQRTGIAPYGHPAGTPGATGVERFGHERMVKGPTAASKGQRIDFSAGIAWFGDILNIEGSFVEIGPRSVFDNWRSVSDSSQWGGSAHDLTPLVPVVPAWGVERGAGE